MGASLLGLRGLDVVGLAFRRGGINFVGVSRAADFLLFLRRPADDHRVTVLGWLLKSTLQVDVGDLLGAFELERDVGLPFLEVFSV